MFEILDVVDNAEVNSLASTVEAEVSVAGLSMVLRSRIKTAEELLVQEVIYIDHAREEQLIIPHYASGRARSEVVRH